jgi:hypothetical protein
MSLFSFPLATLLTSKLKLGASSRDQPYGGVTPVSLITSLSVTFSGKGRRVLVPSQNR